MVKNIAPTWRNMMYFELWRCRVMRLGLAVGLTQLYSPAFAQDLPDVLNAVPRPLRPRITVLDVPPAERTLQPGVEFVWDEFMGEMLPVCSDLSKAFDEVFVFRSPSGEEFTMEFSPFQCADEEEGDGSDNCHSSASGVKNRKVAKTTPATAMAESYTSIEEFRSTLPNMHQGEVNNQAPRCRKEQRVIQISGVYLLAMAPMADNDYHLIVGDSSDPDSMLNIEISGLTEGSTDSMAMARENFEKDWRGICARKSGYWIFRGTNIQQIDIEGSLFYDLGHCTKGVGPGALKPGIPWELHPITYIHKH